MILQELQYVILGSNYTISNSEGTITIDNATNDKDIIFKGTDNSSDITALTLDMSDAGTAIFNHDITLPDLGIVKLGAGSDFNLYHDGTDSWIDNQTGDLYIANYADDKDVILATDNGDGSGVTTYLYLDGSTGLIEIAKTTNILTDTALRFGHASTFIEGMTSGSKLGVYGQTDILLRIGGSTVISMDNAKFEFSIPAIPATSDGVALGSTSKMWSDLFLAS